MLVTAYTEDALKSKLSFFFERSHKVNQSLSSAGLSYMMESSGSKLIF